MMRHGLASSMLGRERSNMTITPLSGGWRIAILAALRVPAGVGSPLRLLP